MSFWLIQSLNSLALGGVLFILASGFSLIFGLMRIANLSHGAYFMLGAYIGYALITAGYSFYVAMLAAAVVVAVIGVIVERIILRRLSNNPLSQVLVTLGIAFVIEDTCLWIWGGDPQSVSAPSLFSGGVHIFDAVFPKYRLVVILFSFFVGACLWVLMEKTRIVVMIRASVDDREMAQGVGVPAKKLFTLVFCLGTFLAGIGGVVAAPILSVYPGLGADMLPIALVVVIFGGLGSLFGAFVGSFIVGFIYTFGQVLFPDLAYIILFLPMVMILAIRPKGLFGKIAN